MAKYERKILRIEDLDLEMRDELDNFFSSKDAELLYEPNFDVQFNLVAIGNRMLVRDTIDCLFNNNPDPDNRTRREWLRGYISVLKSGLFVEDVLLFDKKFNNAELMNTQRAIELGKMALALRTKQEISNSELDEDVREALHEVYKGMNDELVGIIKSKPVHTAKQFDTLSMFIMVSVLRKHPAFKIIADELDTFVDQSSDLITPIDTKSMPEKQQTKAMIDNLGNVQFIAEIFRQNDSKSENQSDLSPVRLVDSLNELYTMATGNVPVEINQSLNFKAAQKGKDPADVDARIWADIKEILEESYSKFGTTKALANKKQWDTEIKNWYDKGVFILFDIIQLLKIMGLDFEQQHTKDSKDTAENNLIERAQIWIDRTNPVIRIDLVQIRENHRKIMKHPVLENVQRVFHNIMLEKLQNSFAQGVFD